MNLGEAVTYLVSEYGWDVFEHLEDYPDEEAAWVVRKARGERHLHLPKNLKRSKLKPKPERKHAERRLHEHKITDPAEIKQKLLELDKRHVTVRKQAEILGYSTSFVCGIRKELGLAKNKAYDNRYTEVRCEDLATGRVAVFPSVTSANRHLGFTESALQGKFFREKTDTVIYKAWKVTKIRGDRK